MAKPERNFASVDVCRRCRKNHVNYYKQVCHGGDGLCNECCYFQCIEATSIKAYNEWLERTGQAFNKVNFGN